MPTPSAAADGAIDQSNGYRPGVESMPHEYRKRHFKFKNRTARNRWWWNAHFNWGYSFGSLVRVSGYTDPTVRKGVHDYEAIARRESRRLEQVEEEEQEGAVAVSQGWVKGDVIETRDIYGEEVLCNVSRANRAIRWIGRNLSLPGADGILAPMRLHDWQKEFLFALYAPVESATDLTRIRTRGLLSCARQNGKSELLAALVCLHLAGPESKPYTNLLCAAKTLDQAAVMFDKVAVLLSGNSEAVERHEDYEAWSPDVPHRAAHRVPSDTERPPRGAQGLPNAFFVVDELAQVTSDEMWNTLSKAQGAAHEPMGIVISTLSDVPDNPMAELMRYAQMVTEPGSEKRDPAWCCKVFAADPGAALDDRDAWRAANPSLGLTLKYSDLETDCRMAMEIVSKEAAFRTYRLNVPVGAYDGIVVWSQWSRNIDESVTLESLRGSRLYGGLDLSRSDALTAMSLFDPDGGRFFTRAWMPEEAIDIQSERSGLDLRMCIREGYLDTTAGDMIDYDDVVLGIAAMIDGLDVAAIAYDRQYMHGFLNSVRHMGVVLPELVEFYQKGMWMTSGIEDFQQRVSTRRLRHRGNPIDNSGVYHTGVKMSDGGALTLKKSSSYAKNDTIAATVFAVGLAMHQFKDAVDTDYGARVSAYETVARELAEAGLAWA